MSLTNADTLIESSSEATKEFLFYFYDAINCISPTSRPDEDPDPSSRTISSGAQALMEEMVQEIRWFRNRNRSSALQLGDLKGKMESIQAETDQTEPSPSAWHQSLKVDNIQEKIVEASQVYGQEGLDKLSKLQQKITQFHKEAIVPAEKIINARLISQDKKQTKKENLQIGYDSVKIPTGGEVADLVTLCVSIGLAVMRPFAEIFCHRKSQGYSREINLIQAERRVDQAALEKLQKHGDRLKGANSALNNCNKALRNINDAMFQRVTDLGDVITQQGPPLNPFSLDLMTLEIGNTMTAQHGFDTGVDEFLNIMENPEHGLIRSPTTVHIDDFHFKTKEVSKLVGCLLSAKDIIREKHQNDFAENSCKIAMELAQILDKVKEVFISWARLKTQGSSEPIALKMKKEAVAVTSSLVPFDREVRKCIAEITQILGKKPDKSSIKRLQKLQKDGDRVLEKSEWEGRPLATISEASDIVQRLEDIAGTISTLSNEVILPLTLMNGRGNGGFNPPTGQESQRDLTQVVSEYTLTTVSTMLSTESIELKNLSSTNT